MFAKGHSIARYFKIDNAKGSLEAGSRKLVVIAFDLEAYRKDQASGEFRLCCIGLITSVTDLAALGVSAHVVEQQATLSLKGGFVPAGAPAEHRVNLTLRLRVG